MKKIILLSSFYLLLNSGYAQINVLYDYFTTSNTVPCPVDSQITLNNVTNWEAYQTYTGNWWDTHDTTHCFNTFSVARNSGIIAIGEADTSRVIFLRYRLDSINKIPLQGNSMCYFNFNMYSSPNMNLNGSNNCNGLYCSGVLLGLEIPDSLGIGTDIRWYNENFTITGSSGSIEMCFPTEYFHNGNFLRYLLFTFKTNSQSTLADTILLNQVSLDVYPVDHSLVQSISDSVELALYNSSQYDYTLYGSSINSPFIFLHDTTSYPSVNHMTFYDAYPIPNVAVQSTVNLNFISAEFTLQNFTALRGGLVKRDTIRHLLNIIQDGNICMPPFLDMFSEDGNTYTYKSGRLELHGTTACLGFGRGSKLIIADNANFDYGYPHRGSVELKTGGTIEIGKNSSLTIHNKLKVSDYANMPQPQRIFLTLNPHSRLTFAPGSVITNEYSTNQMKLTVYMKGGILDDSGLNEESKKLIIRVYDEPNSDPQNNLYIWIEQGKIFYTNIFKTETDFIESITDSQGRVIEKRILHPQKGFNSFEYTEQILAAGVYILGIESTEGSIYKKFVAE